MGIIEHDGSTFISSNAISSEPDNSTFISSTRSLIRRRLLPERVADIILLFTYAISAAVAIFVIYQLIEQRAENHVIAISTAGFAVAIALPLSIWDVNKHVRHFVSPLQRHYIRIILMIPINVLESWLALTFKDQHIYLEVLREAYEAWVIYTVQRLFVDFLGGRDGVESLLAARAASTGSDRAHFLPPFSRFSGWRFRNDFQSNCNAAVFQYVFLRVVFASASLVAEFNDTLCEGSTDFLHCLYPWSTVILSGSQFCAMYALVLFYHQLDVELKPLHALSKVLAVKAVVFLAFWQSSLIAFLSWRGNFDATSTYTPDEITSGLSNFLICWEMAIAAFAHHFIFDYKHVLTLVQTHSDSMQAFEAGRALPAAALVMLLPHDAISEAQGHISHAVGVPIKMGETAVRALRVAAGVTMSPTRDLEKEPFM